MGLGATLPNHIPACGSEFYLETRQNQKLGIMCQSRLTIRREGWKSSDYIDMMEVVVFVR